MQLTSGMQCFRKAKNVFTTNKYLQSASMNGKPYPYSYITIKQIGQGSMLLLNMGDKPSKWGTQIKNRPVSIIPETSQQ